jgi:GNAT superfamily N-acetyltransferase
MNTNDKIRIRNALPQDKEMLAKLGAKTFSDSFARDNTPQNMAAYLAGAFGPGKQAKELADTNSRYLIAESDATVVGYARLQFGPAHGDVGGGQPVEIARLYARKAWIGKGVGKRLMEACLETARKAGCDRIWLGVWEKNRQAIAFYEKWGFGKVGEKVFQLGDDPQRDWLMVKHL